MSYKFEMDEQIDQPNIFIQKDPFYIHQAPSLKFLNYFTKQDFKYVGMKPCNTVLFENDLIDSKNHLEEFGKNLDKYLLREKMQMKDQDEIDIELTKLQEFHQLRLDNLKKKQNLVNASRNCGKFTDNFKKLMGKVKQHQIKLELKTTYSSEIDLILKRRQESFDNFSDFLKNLMSQPNLMLIQELLKEYKLFELDKLEDVIRVFKQLNLADKTNENLCQLLQIIIVCNSISEMKLDHISLISNKEYFVIILIALSPKQFLFKEVSILEILKIYPELEKIIVGLHNKSLKILQFFTKACIDQGLQQIVTEQLGVMLNKMITDKKSSQICRLSAYLSTILENTPLEYLKSIKPITQFVKEQLLEDMKKLSHEPKDCEVCKIGKIKFIEKLESFL
ncbi:UNKNOWN [Stylonychia lemnae]|uniref:Uncharacterized protein n=1 Tax=Stylonychia lemnae TaxID=5949 RepID=A0A078AHP7_STYLE|nr:UNKNOWN [Stylonychia lemnae]|eukprot:CDW81779.1 UNKNOWN [Stylonychia lemnae]